MIKIEIYPFASRIYLFKNRCCFLYENSFEIRDSYEFNVLSKGEISLGKSKFKDGVIYMSNLGEQTNWHINLLNLTCIKYHSDDLVIDGVGEHFRIMFDYHSKRKYYLHDVKLDTRDFVQLANCKSSRFISNLKYLVNYNSEQRSIMAICLSDKKTIWNFPLQNKFSKILISSVIDIVIVVESNNNEFYKYYAINSNTGQLIWTYGFTSEEMLFVEDESYIVFSNYNYFRPIDIETGIGEPVENHEFLSPWFRILRSGAIYYKSLKAHGIRDWRFGKIPLESGIVEWEYILKDENEIIIQFKELIPSDSGKMIITSTDPTKQTIHFDPYDPENIPYRTIDNGVINDKNNPYPL